MKWLGAKFPGKEVSISSDTRDEQTWLINASSDTEPGETYLFDRKKHKAGAAIQDVAKSFRVKRWPP